MGEVSQEWLSLGVQTVGACAVCGMFLLYLKHKHAEDEESRKTFLEHMQAKDTMHATALQHHMDYLQTRDAASNEALRQISDTMQLLRGDIIERTAALKHAIDQIS